MKRLDKILSSQNIGSRKEVTALIKRGVVTVDGNIVRDRGYKVNPMDADIRINNISINYRTYIYIMMNKPEGVLSASKDSRQRTVLDLLPDKYMRRGLFPAGRLDKDTTGLLILTNDGEFAHRMLSPKNKICKLYRAVTERRITENDIAEFLKGVHISGKSFYPAQLWEEVDEGQVYALVRIHEGKFHQVKRMFLSQGNRVIKLERIKIGQLELDLELNRGESRLMTEEEIGKIFEK